MSCPNFNENDQLYGRELQKNQRTKLMIIYLPSMLSEEDFLHMFLQIGRISSYRMPRNEDGTPKGFAFVTYENPDDAARAIGVFNGYDLGGKRLKVHYSRPGGRRRNCNIFTTNLPASWTTATLYARFGELGEILDAKILKHQDGTSRLCGFVRFDEAQAAQAAIDTYDSFRPKGAYRPIKVRLAQRQEDFWKAKGVGAYSKRKAALLKQDGYITDNLTDQPESTLVKTLPMDRPPQNYPRQNDERRLFLWNLPTFLPQEQILSICGRYGRVVDFTLQKSNSDVSLGMCFVQYSTPEELEQAQEALDKCEFCEQQVSATIVNI